MNFSKSFPDFRNIRPKKHMGQNFLNDPSSARMIVRRGCVQPDDVVLEIGPGLGALTFPLARAAAHVYAVEKDRDLVDVLGGAFSGAGISNVTLINENILDFSFDDLRKEAGRPLLVFGNLPYNISSAVILLMIDHRHLFSRCIFMLQKEVACRLRALPGSRDYGRLSVRLGYCSDMRKLASVGPHLFYPRPRVESEVIEIRFRPETGAPVYDEAVFSEVVKAAFGQRRKTIKNSLAGSHLAVSGKIVDAVLSEARIDGSRRAETLSVEEFVTLTNAMGRFLA